MHFRQTITATLRKEHTMKNPRLPVLLSIAAVAIAVTASVLWAAHPAGDEPVIAVSPSTLVLSSASNVCVSVHSNIPFRSVVLRSLELNGLTPYAAFPDSQGYLVAKFDRDTVKTIVSAPGATLTLSGARTDGTTFAASDTIVVKD